MDRLLEFSSLMHQSRWPTSSFCCLPSSATILSISTFTFSKVSSCAEAARSASAGAPVLPATFWSRVETLLRLATVSEVSSLAVTEDTCTKELTVLSMLAKASSELRILMVSSTAAISVRRSFTRLSKSVPLLEHFSVRFARKVSSRPSCSWVPSSSLKAWACFSFRSAICWSSSETIFLPEEISSSLAAFRASNSARFFFSLASSSLRSFSKSSFIWSRMPMIWPLWGA
mmetsp:Transcript_35533/g.94125  ORF Transcript_35533/g.94125 Transcript_35533/m.94125 type:complete len:230 (+) Transcript_35533:823-1512(+)